MKKSDKIIGFHSGHDCSYAILDNGIPVLHNELERFTREKEHLGDAINFIEQTYPAYKDVQYYAHVTDNWKGGPEVRNPKNTKHLKEILKSNGGELYYFGHHATHAANAFYSSNFDEALIITIDAGGTDFRKDIVGKTSYNKDETMDTTLTISYGSGNDIERLLIKPIYDFNIGGTWNKYLENIFDLSTGHPHGNQAGTVMAMACMGDYEKYGSYFMDRIHLPHLHGEWDTFKKDIKKDTVNTKFHIAAAIQWATEYQVQKNLEPYLIEYNPKNICMAGGVSLNSVLIGKMYEWYPNLENIYIPPVPYDAGLSIGTAQTIWHHKEFMNQPRITWKDNSPTYLGFTYHNDTINEAIENNKDKITTEVVDDETVIDLLCKDDNVISVYGGGSESGRRALGNRSILADPRSKNMKDIINKKVKHRQWFRPFAPSILKEDVKDWFVRDVDSPYMTTVLKFKEEIQDKVPAVVHLDGTGRLLTVTKNDNEWYHGFISKFKEKTGVPIVLNTSFNDREPIVETPEHAINCFLRTDIDYLYFNEPKILLKKI